MTKLKFGRMPAICVLAGVSLVAATPVYAAAAAAPQAGRHIEDVVVTAERKEATVQDTAISITAISSKFIVRIESKIKIGTLIAKIKKLDKGQE